MESSLLPAVQAIAILQLATPLQKGIPSHKQIKRLIIPPEHIPNVLPEEHHTMTAIVRSADALTSIRDGGARNINNQAKSIVSIIQIKSDDAKPKF